MIKEYSISGSKKFWEYLIVLARLGINHYQCQTHGALEAPIMEEIFKKLRERVKKAIEEQK